jgi:hypothetical protein
MLPGENLSRPAGIDNQSGQPFDGNASTKVENGRLCLLRLRRPRFSQKPRPSARCAALLVAFGAVAWHRSAPQISASDLRVRDRLAESVELRALL